MRNLPVDFAPPSRLVPVLGNALSLLLFALAAQQTWQALQIRRERLAIEAGMEAGMAIAQNAPDSATLQASDDKAQPAPPPYHADAAAIAHAAAFDMDKVLRAVESARVAGVRVSVMELDADKHSARIEIELGQEVDALARYLKALNGDDDHQGRWRLLHADFPLRLNPRPIDASPQPTTGLTGSAVIGYFPP